MIHGLAGGVRERIRIQCVRQPLIQGIGFN